MFARASSKESNPAVYVQSAATPNRATTLVVGQPSVDPIVSIGLKPPCWRLWLVMLELVHWSSSFPGELRSALLSCGREMNTSAAHGDLLDADRCEIPLS